MLLPLLPAIGSEVDRTGTFGRIGGVSGVMLGGVTPPCIDSLPLLPGTVGFLIFIRGIVAGGGLVAFVLTLGVVNGASVGLSATGAFDGMRRNSTAGRPLSCSGDGDSVDDTMSDIFVTLTVAGGRSRFGTGFFVDGISFV